MKHRPKWASGLVAVFTLMTTSPSASFVGVQPLWASSVATEKDHPLSLGELQLLLEQQRWYSALLWLDLNGANVEAAGPKLQKTLEGLRQRLLRKTDAKVHWDVASKLFENEAFVTCQEVLAKLPNGLKATPKVKNLMKASREGEKLREVEGLFHRGQRDEATLILKQMKGEKVDDLKNKMRQSQNMFNKMQQHMASQRYGKAQGEFEKLKVLLGSSDHADVKRAGMLLQSISEGHQGDLGIEMIAEGDRRAERGDRDGAMQLYKDALVHAPALAYKKIHLLETMHVELYQKSEEWKDRDLDRAIRYLVQAIEIAPESFKDIARWQRKVEVWKKKKSYQQAESVGRSE